MLEHAPRLSTDQAERLAKAVFGIDGHATPLTSERDQNFLVTGDRTIVLKVANADEQRGVIEAQQAAMRHLAGLGVVPAVLTNVVGESIAAGRDRGRRHMVWGVSHLPGTPLSTLRHRSATLAKSVGMTAARLSNAFAGFDHGALHREFHWDLARGRDVVARNRALVQDAEIAAAIDTLVDRFDRLTAPGLDALPRSVIHNDLNSDNLLVGGGIDLFERNQHVTGVVDFGDMVHSYTVGDLAVAIAYMVLDAPDPLSTLHEMVRGYHVERAVSEPELSALFGLATLRLCMSACIGAEQTHAQPDNEYLTVSQAPLRRTLPRLARIPFAFAEATARDACRLEPVASSLRVRTWLAAHTRGFASVLDTDLKAEPSLVLDLSAGSPLVSGDARENEEPALTQRVFSAMRTAGVRVSVGRYDEPRLLYVAPFFAAGDGTLDERRTIHIGLDLFASAGTPVYAPMTGTVHLFGKHMTPQDYGHVIILRHVTDEGTEFFTLYGHLSAASLDGLVVGQSVRHGQRVGWLGTPAENVGWTPHLHLQIMTDLLELGSDFAGVGTASRRSVWRSVCPDPNLIVGIPEDRFPAPMPPKAATVERRRAHIGGNVSIAYRNPVRTVRGWKQYLYDDVGHRYIDAYNNVPHVGHSHPRVASAVADQMRLLNTNTRYLNDSLGELAARLSATMPRPLEVCYFLNSASEANELALRLARTYTHRRDIVVLDAAYHGNTTSLVDISPYKHAGPGGNGAPDWVHTVPIADDYRGEYRRDNRRAGRDYASDVARRVIALQSEHRSPGAFIAETCPSVGGQIIFPEGYLAGVYDAIRGAGGVCIADEVQTGLGRMGTHFWAFEAQQVVPDIVVVGKPLGNGHPVAALVTTRAIADAFDNGMEFFSTFGGNNVSCVAALTVLDVLRDEQLQQHALTIGDRMLAGLREFPSRHALVGDVRGSGLFLGVELVRNRETLEPASEEASYVANRMREEGILLGTDGPFHNVVKIRPPMPFGPGDADRLVETLDRVLAELG